MIHPSCPEHFNDPSRYPDKLDGSMSSERRKEYLEDASRLTRHMLRTYTPEQIIEAVRGNQDTPGYVPLSPDQHAKKRAPMTIRTICTIAELLENGPRDKRDDPKKIKKGWLFFGGAVDDTGLILMEAAKRFPHLSDEELLETMSQPDTVELMASVALGGHKQMRAVEANLRNTLAINPEGAFSLASLNRLTGVSKEINIPITRDGRGCPAAGFPGTSSYEGKVDPLPIFKEIIPWATEVHLLSDEWKEFRASLITPTLEN